MRISKILKISFIFGLGAVFFIGVISIDSYAGTVADGNSSKVTPCKGSGTYRIGSGIYDITGPAAELGMMGYARIGQKTAGIHTRLWSRAFVIASPCNDNRVAIVSADLGLISQAVKQKVVERLQQTFGDLYHDGNVLLSATHTHSGPGGYSHYVFYNLTILGFDEQNFNAIVDGVVQSVIRAHQHLVQGTIKIAIGELPAAGINRSAEAYLENPEAERSRYDADTDTRMTLLKFERADGEEMGTLNWFAVHGTSMGNDNLLISGDNKGYASYLFEKLKKSDYRRPKTFVAAFAQSNCGDVTPNIFGGEDGGGDSDFESTAISAHKQFEMALQLYNDAARMLTGGVNFRHRYVKMNAVAVSPDFTDGAEAETCPAGIGISMAAGAEDGPGFGQEGWTCADGDNFWADLFCDEHYSDCQAEKPVVLETGSMQPYPWTPAVLPLQIVTIGNLALVAVPFELTTMAGRRLRQTVANRLNVAGIDTVVVAGLSNAYAGYVTTRQEYALQHYEGASTHFGPWTLAALRQEFDDLASALLQNRSVDPGPSPLDLSCCQETLQTGVVYDDKPLFKKFGSVHLNVNSAYRRGEIVKVVFWGGHPKNNLKTQDSFLEIQRKEGRNWVPVARDLDWETKYLWKRIACVPTFGCSHVTVLWDIPADTVPGIYRIRHFGHWKSGWDGHIRAYKGTSREFRVR
jgi:neutral ceramidase